MNFFIEKHRKQLPAVMPCKIQEICQQFFGKFAIFAIFHIAIF